MSDLDEFVLVLRFVHGATLRVLAAEYALGDASVIVHHGLAILCYFWTPYYLRLLPPPKLIPETAEAKAVTGGRPVLVVDNQEHHVTSSEVLGLHSLLASSKLKFKSCTVKLGNVTTTLGRAVYMPPLFGGGADEKVPLLDLVATLRRFAARFPVCQALLDAEVLVICDRGYLHVDDAELPATWRLTDPAFLQGRQRFETDEAFYSAVLSAAMCIFVDLESSDDFFMAQVQQRLRVPVEQFNGRVAVHGLWRQRTSTPMCVLFEVCLLAARMCVRCCALLLNDEAECVTYCYRRWQCR